MHYIKLLFFLSIGNRDYIKTLPLDGWSREKILNEIDDLIDLGKFQFNKTRDLSRPAICWIHYVHIAQSISEHLSQVRTSEMPRNDQQCSTMFNNPLK